MTETNGIIICEKPDTVTFDEIHELIRKANRVNREKGFVLKTSSLTGKQLMDRIGKDGKCFTALDGTRPVGTLSVRFVNRNTWYLKGRTANYILAAIDPDYQGKHILSLLFKEAEKYVCAQGYMAVELDTAEGNEHAIAIYKHYGFKPVSYKANPGGDHYSVIMVKWLKGCPFTNRYCNIRYEIKRAYIKTRYKPNKQKRFKI